MLFGLYPSKYIGGNPNILNNGGFYPFGRYYGSLGIHPSSISSAGIDYFAKKGQSPIRTNPNLIQQTVVPNIQNPLNSSTDSYTAQTNTTIQNMQATLDNIKNEQGVIGKVWDGIKGATGIGASSKKCQTYIEQAKTGTMGYEQAANKINEYAFRQKSAVNLITGLSAGALSLLAINKGSGVKGILAATGIGAGTKAFLKTFERGTNNIENDAFDAKQISKDGISGALNGAIFAAGAMLGSKGASAAGTTGQSLHYAAGGGAIKGAAAGSAISASDYAIECAFGDEKFETNKLVTNAAYGAAAGGALGAFAGGVKSIINKNETPKVESEKPAAPKDSIDKPSTGESKTPAVPDKIEEPVNTGTKTDKAPVENKGTINDSTKGGNSDLKIENDITDIQPDSVEISAIDERTSHVEPENITIGKDSNKGASDSISAKANKEPCAKLENTNSKVNADKLSSKSKSESAAAESKDFKNSSVELKPDNTPQPEVKHSAEPEITASTASSSNPAVQPKNSSEPPKIESKKPAAPKDSIDKPSTGESKTPAVPDKIEKPANTGIKKTDRAPVENKGAASDSTKGGNSDLKIENDKTPFTEENNVNVSGNGYKTENKAAAGKTLDAKNENKTGTIKNKNTAKNSGTSAASKPDSKQPADPLEENFSRVISQIKNQNVQDTTAQNITQNVPSFYKAKQNLINKINCFFGN